MSSDAAADEVALEVDGDDGEPTTVYCAVDNLVSVRRLAKHSGDSRMLTFLPGVLAAVALLVLGHWLLAVAMVVVGAGFVGWYSVESIRKTVQADTFDAHQDDPLTSGTVGQPAAVTTVGDGIQAQSIDLDTVTQKLATADIDFQEYSGTFENAYYEIAYEYLVVPGHVTDVSVSPGSHRNVRNYMLAAAGAFFVLLFVITNDLGAAAIPAGVFALASLVLDPLELPATVAVQTGEGEDVVGGMPLEDAASYRQFLLPTADAERFAENIRTGDRRDLGSEEAIVSESGEDPLETEFAQPSDFEAALDTIREELQSSEKVVRSGAASKLSDGARKYPDVAVAAVPAAIDALDDSYDLVRDKAISTLQYVAGVSAEVSADDVERIVTALVDLLDDPEESVRIAAVHALAAWAEAEPSAVRAHLEDILAAGHAPITVPADPEEDGMLAALTTTIESNQEQVRLKRGLIRLLSALAVDDPDQVADRVRTQLDTGASPAVTEVGLQVLANVAGEYPEAVQLPEHFETYLTDETTRFDALYLANELSAGAPAKLEPHAAGVNAVLETQPIDHDSAMDNRTVNAIGTLRSLAALDPAHVRDPEGWLPDCLTHASPAVRRDACRLLATLGREALPADFDVEPILRRRLTDDERDVRAAACEAVRACQIRGLDAELERCEADGVPGAGEALAAVK